MKFAKKEEVTVSFHFLVRLKDKNNRDAGFEPITMAEFDEIFTSLESAQNLDLKEDDILNAVRAKRIAPILKLERDNSRTISGLFKSSYYGHSYENNIKGDISADSVNLRPFFFQLYLAESGRLYIASQYLGLYGGYTQIRNTIINSFSDKTNIEARSINVSHLDIANAEIKEIEVEYSKKSSSVASKNKFGKRGTLSVRAPEGDQQFEAAVRARLNDRKQNKSSQELRKALANLLRDDELLDLEDDEIEACRVLVRSNNKYRYVYVISGTDFATRFPLDVPKIPNGHARYGGHPQYGPLKSKVNALLRTEIVAKRENV